MLYVMVILTTVSGWLFASFRGWSISFFYLIPFPMLSSDNPTADGLHQAAEWSLLGLVAVHVAAALRVMSRMLPGETLIAATSTAAPS
jgi:cytochrome b561